MDTQLQRHSSPGPHRFHSLSLAHRNATTPTRQARPIRESLRRQDHVAMLPQLHPQLRPRIEVLSSRDRPTNALLRSHRPELCESTSPFDRRLVYTLARVDLVRPLFRREVAPPGPRLSRRQNIIRLDDVVFNQRVLRPAVERQVAGAFWRVCARVLHSSEATGQRVL
jgi:hypothetical protein